MLSYEFEVWVYTLCCYSWDYEIFNGLEVELHEYVDIIMHIAEISRFYDELWIFIL